MFVRHLRAHCGSPENMAHQCTKAGLRWVAIMAAWQNNRVKWYNANIEDYAIALRSVGVDVWVWGYPQPNIHPSFVDAMRDRALAADAKGIILDPEKPWIGRAPVIAYELVRHLRAHVNLPVGFTSYGWPANFKKFPWKAFAESCDFSIPQAYDTHDNMGPHYQQHSVRAYKKLGFKNIVPGLRTYNIRPDKIAEIYGRTPMPVDAVVWWDWFNTGQREWDIIAKLPQPGEARTS